MFFLLCRFWVALRFKQLYLSRSSGKTAPMEELDIDSSMIAWAFHSESQENLSGSLLPNESSWQQMRSLGFGFWYSNVAQLRSRVSFKIQCLVQTSYARTHVLKLLILMLAFLSLMIFSFDTNKQRLKETDVHLFF